MDESVPGDSEREGQREATRIKLAIAAGVLNGALAFAGVSGLSVWVLYQQGMAGGTGWKVAGYLVPALVLPVTLVAYHVAALGTQAALSAEEGRWSRVVDRRLAVLFFGTFVPIAFALGAARLLVDLGWAVGWWGWLLALMGADAAWTVGRAIWRRQPLTQVLRRLLTNGLLGVVIFGGIGASWMVAQPTTKTGTVGLAVVQLLLLGGVLLASVVGYPQYRGLRLLVLAWRGQWDDALRLAEQFGVGHPGRAFVYAVLLDADRLDEAAVRMQEELPTLEPSELEPYPASLVGWLALFRGDLDRAEAGFTAAGAMGTIGLVRTALARGAVDAETLDRATTAVNGTHTGWIHRWAGADPTVGPRALRAWVLAELERQDDVRAEVAEVVDGLANDLPGHNAPAHWLLAQALTRLGDDEGARAHLERGAVDTGLYGRWCRGELGQDPDRSGTSTAKA